MWQMYLIYGIAMGIGLGGMFVPIISLVAKRFKVNRSLMTGVTLASNGFGQMISPLVSHQLITIYDWRTSYIILGFIIFILVVFPAQVLKRPRPESEKEYQSNDTNKQTQGKYTNYTLRKARCTRPFWMIMLIFGLGGFCLTTTTVHLVPYALETGISASTAANILACFCGFLIVGRLALGSYADKIGNRHMIIIGLILTIGGLLWLTQAREVWKIVLFAIVGGLGMGGITPSLSPLVAKFFGLKAHGLIFGMIGGGAVVIGATGPFIIGYLFDLTGKYQVPFLVCAFMGTISLIISILLRPPKASQESQTENKK
jgi:MFS family permease